MKAPDKAAVVAALNRSLREQLDTLLAVAAMARDEIGSDETRQESKYDTRSTEASYLARGQAWRIEQLQRLQAWVELFELREQSQVAVGALVALSGPRQDLLFVAPIGGAKVEIDGTVVRVVSPGSPLGQAMAELEAGDGFVVTTPQGDVEWEVTGVS